MGSHGARSLLTPRAPAARQPPGAADEGPVGKDRCAAVARDDARPRRARSPKRAREPTATHLFSLSQERPLFEGVHVRDDKGRSPVFLVYDVRRPRGMAGTRRVRVLASLTRPAISGNGACAKPRILAGAAYRLCLIDVEDGLPKRKKKKQKIG